MHAFIKDKEILKSALVANEYVEEYRCNKTQDGRLNLIWKTLTRRIGTAWTLLCYYVKEGIQNKMEEMGIWMYIYNTFLD